MSAQRMLWPRENTCVVFVLFFRALCISDRRGCGHRRIDTNGEHGHGLFVFQLPDQIKNFLCSTHRKGWDQYGSISFRCVENDTRQRDFGQFRIVQAISVGRFTQEIVTGWRRNWIADDRLIVVSQIAREENTTTCSIITGLIDLDEDKTRSEDMP